MTIEMNLASIAKSLETIANALSQRPVQSAPTVMPAAPVTPVPVTPVPATPVVQSTPTVSFAPAVQTISATPTTFADHNAFVQYVMDSYRALGPIKGAAIQDVLGSVGVKNINDVKAEMYAQVKAGIDALKA